jgi:hypothetical protein
VSCKWVK